MKIQKSLLERLVEMSRLSLDKSPINFQQDLIYDHIKDYFPDVPREELHFELLCNGLFEPEEVIDLDKTLRQLNEKNVWRIVQEEYERLKRLWNGEECPIFIFPLTKHRPIIDGVVANKNGVCYKEAIFLFVSPELEDTELKAMIAHEYHHYCRLSVLNKAPEEMPLKESIIIEGMAECMVEQLYGEKWCSPWISRYSHEKNLREIWSESFVPSLNMKGIHNHQQFLYGDGTDRFPNWIGYCIGYAIVKSI